MSSVFFGNAARILSTVFDWLQISGQSETSNLIMDTFQYGIDKATGAGEGFTLVPGTSSLSVTVQGQGIAYDVDSARIFISASDVTLYNPANVTATTNDGLGNMLSTPQSSGVVNIPLTPSSLNYLWINYLVTTDTSEYTLNLITEAKIFFKLTDGYNIQVTTVNIPPDASSVFLGTIDLTSVSSGVIPPSTISQIGRQYFNILPNIVPITTAQANRSDATATYDPASTYVLDTHIKAVGTGNVSALNPHGTSLQDLGISTLDTVIGHRQLEHGNAIIAGVPGTPYPSTSAMATSINTVNPGSDYLTVFQLLTTEFAIVNGTAYNVTDIFGAIPANAQVFFPSVTGTYNVYWDSVTNGFSATTADISSSVTKLWIATVTYTYVGTGPSDHNALSALISRRQVGSTTHLLQRWITNSRPGVGATQPNSGEFGFNLTTGLLEYWDGSAWQQPITGTLVANLNANGHKITNLADGTAAADAINFSQVSGKRILQVVQATTTGGETTSSTSFASTTLVASITPASTANKIKITISGSFGQAASNSTAYFTISRNGSSLVGGGGLATVYSLSSQGNGSGCIVYVDSPASVASTSYRLQFKTDSGGTATLNSNGALGSPTAVIVLEEIG